MPNQLFVCCDTSPAKMSQMTFLMIQPSNELRTKKKKDQRLGSALHLSLKPWGNPNKRLRAASSASTSFSCLLFKKKEGEVSGNFRKPCFPLLFQPLKPLASLDFGQANLGARDVTCVNKTEAW